MLLTGGDFFGRLMQEAEAKTAGKVRTVGSRAGAALQRCHAPLPWQAAKKADTKAAKQTARDVADGWVCVLLRTAMRVGRIRERISVIRALRWDYGAYRGIIHYSP